MNILKTNNQSSLTPLNFEILYWANDSSSVKLSGGRGASQKVVVDGNELVLRRYLRGGFMAKLSYDSYLWLGVKNTRPYQECKVLEYAIQKGLPVPKCIGYSIDRHGLFYRAGIMTEYISNVGTLASYLNDQELTQSQWLVLAQTIATMHQVNINHADLNADNILISVKDDDLFFSVIDFDKARIETNANDWPQSNVKRLLRSLNKLKPLYFNEQAEGYFKQSFNL